MGRGEAALSAPLVSVVLPVRNGERFLGEAVDSVLTQTVRELELVAVDDGSTDDTRSILEGYAHRDPRVRVIARGREGLTAALRAGCAAAGGRYLARMDADDVALPDRLARQAERLEADAGLAVCGGAVVILDERGRRGATVRYPASDGEIRRALLSYNCFAHPAVTMRRSAYEAVGGYRLENGEDYDLWLRLAERFRLENLPDPVLLYRHHPGQYSVARVDEQAVGVLAAQYAARLRRVGRPDPLDRAPALTADTRAALGLTAEAVAEAQVAHRLRWAALLEQQGSAATADELYAAAAAVLSGSTFVVRRAFARAQAAARARRPGRAARVLAAALVAHPLSFPRELRRALRSRRSFEPAR